MKKRSTETLGATGLLLAAMVLHSPLGSAAGIVASIDKAPVTADGNVTGIAADFVITLDRSLDHAVPGRTLLDGDQIKVFLPADFDLGNLAAGYPIADLPNGAVPCVPNNVQCTTAVILKGWPQEPFFPPAAFHSVSIDVGANAFVYTANQDMVDGVKQLHLILHGVPNPSPGQYRIRVEAQTGPGGTWESGSGTFHVLPKSRPSVNVTSVLVKATSGILNPGTPVCGPGTLPPNPHNPVDQNTSVNTAAPYTWTFLLWGRDNEPLDDVTLQWVNPDHALIRRGKRNVGHAYIDAPKGAIGYGIQQNPVSCPTLMPGAPVIGPTPGIGPQPVGRLDLLFMAGNLAGDYTTTISLNNGNSVQMVVTAQ